jgi:hypothetical protein
MKEQLTKEESLELITTMINHAKNRAVGGSFYFLFWGYVVLAAYLGHYALLMYHFEYPFLVWLINIPAAIISAIYGSREEKRRRVKTYTDHVFSSTWTALIIPIVAAIVFGQTLGFENITGVILLMVGIGIYLSGQLMKFKPLILGSFVIWLAAILALYFNSEVQYLIGAAAVVLGYLIPGYMIKRIERNG